MTTIITAAGLGTYNDTRGARANPLAGRAGQSDAVYVNSSTGNLVIQARDEFVSALGVDVALVRTYNAQGRLNDDNGDNWRLSAHRRLDALPAAVNTAGSSVRKTYDDGAEFLFTYDAARGLYVSTGGEGAHDTLSFNATTQQWSWSDGTPGVSEIYDIAGRLVACRDSDGNTSTYSYTGALLTQITDASGQTTFLDYSGNNLTQIRVVYQGVTRTATRYAYDASNRLVEVQTDLSPENSVIDNNVYRTRYTYDSTSSKRVASITHGDGSTVSFTYVPGSDGVYRVASYTEGAGSAARTTSFSYTLNPAGSSTSTRITNALGQVTTQVQDALGQLLSVQSAQSRTDYTYDAAGNLKSLTQDPLTQNPTGLNRTTIFEYDSRGNQILARDASGNTVTRIYNSANQLLSETTYLVSDADGAGAALPGLPNTARFVYDSEAHLRFSISAEGRVTENRYDGPGRLLSTIRYQSFYTATVSSEADLIAWSKTQDLTRIERSDFTYDFRGNLSTTTVFSATDGAGVGLAAGSSRTQFVYDQRGRLLQTLDARAGAATPDPNNAAQLYATTYLYDGLDRVLRVSKSLNGGATALTTWSYDDAGNRLITTVSNDTNTLTTTSVYDKSGLLLSVTNNAGTAALGTTTYAYDAAGRLRMVSDPSGVRRHTLYDTAGRKIADIDGDGSVLEYVYNRANEVVKTIAYASRINTALLVDTATQAPLNLDFAILRPAANAADQVSRAVYDNAGRLVYAIDPAGAVNENRYDGESHLIDTLAYATPVTIARATDEVLPATVAPLIAPSANDRRTRYFYSVDGQRSATLDAEGYFTTVSFDAKGRQTATLAYALQITDATLRTSGTRAQLLAAVSAAPAAVAEKNIASVTLFDGQGRVVGQVDGERYLTETQYDVVGNITQVIRYDRPIAADATSRLADLKLLLAGAASRTASYQYDAANRLIQDTDAEGTLTTYTYDRTGNLISQTRAAGTDPRTVQSRYDALGRVKQELSAEGASRLIAGLTEAQINTIWEQYGTSYNYDLAGRRVSATSKPFDSISSQTLTTLFYYNEDDQLRFTVNALGERTELRYNALGQVTDQITYQNRLATAGLTGGLLTTALITQLTGGADATRDARTSRAYTVRGEIQTETSAEGASVTRTYNAFGEQATRATLVDTRTLNSTLAYDKRGLLIEAQSDATGLNILTKSTFDAFGRVATATDARGNVVRFDYDRLGRTLATTDSLTTGVGAVTRTRRQSYDAFDRVSTDTDALGKVTTFSYNDLTRSIVVTTPEGITLTTVRNRHGQTASVTDARGIVTTWSYDKNGNQTGSTRSGVTTQQSFDSAGRLLTQTDARGTVTKISYDAASRVFKRTLDTATGGLGLTTTYLYDGQGRVTDVTATNGVLTRTSYDRDNRVTEVAIDPAGLNLRTTYAYDKAGHVITQTEGTGSVNPRTTRFVFDVLGRRTQQIVDPGTGKLNLTTTFAYDKNGNVIQRTDANGNLTRLVYDAADRLRFTLEAPINGLAAVIETRYDAEDRISATLAYATPISVATLPAGELGITDLLSRVTANAQDALTVSVYDRDGRQVFTVDAAGAVTRNVYDGNGNVIRQLRYATAIAVAPYATVAEVEAKLVLDPLRDRVLHSVYDNLDRLVYTVDAAGAVARVERDAAGAVIATAAFATLRATTLPVDLANLTTWAAQSAIANHPDNRSTRFWYDAAGREVFKLDAEGALSETRYNDTQRTTSTVLYRDRVTLSAGATLAQVRANSVVTNFNAARERVSTSERDAAGRVVRVYDALTAASASTYEQSLYDAVGNRIATIDPRGIELAERNSEWARAERTRLGFAIDASTLSEAQRAALRARYTTTRTFDAAGRELIVTDALGFKTTQTYDAVGHLVKLTDAREASGYRYYDPAGHLRYQIDPLGYVTELRYDALDQVVEELSYATALSGAYSQTTPLSEIASRLSASASDRRLTREFDVRGLIKTVTYFNTPSNYTETFQYDAFGQKIQFKDKNGAVFNYEYSVRGELRKEISPQVDVVTQVLPTLLTQTLRLETVSEYNAFGERAALTEAAGTAQQRTTRYAYDHLGREARIEAPTFAVYTRASNTSALKTPVTTRTYDSAGNLIVEVAANGGRTVHYYDSRNLRIATVSADAVLSEYAYDAVGNRTAERIYGTRLSGALDPNVKPAPVNTEDYRELKYQYNANNQRVRTDTRAEALFSHELADLTRGDGRYIKEVVTLAEYDANGNVVKLTDGNGNVSRQYYDAQGNRVLAVDAAGFVVRSEYNAQGDLIRETRYAGKLSLDVRTLSATATLQSILSAIPAGDDRITEYGYDPLGRRISERKLGVAYAQVNASSGALTELVGNLTTRFEYDGNGNLLAQINPNTATNPNGNRINFAYDALGRQIDRQDPSFQAFNGGGAARVLTRSETVFKYDAFGNQVQEVQLGSTVAENRETRRQYDLAGNLREQREQRDAQGAVITYDYDYDIDGNTVRTSRNVTDVNRVTHLYRSYHTYDIAGREISRQDIEDEGAAAQVVRETQDTRYNAYGDIEARGVNGQYQEKYLYDKLGRLFYTNKENGTPRLYIYDANGNAVVEIHGINSDLSRVSENGVMRDIRGPIDLALIDIRQQQFTFSFYDARNQLIRVADPPLEYGTLLAIAPTVMPSGTNGYPKEGPNDVMPYFNLPTGLLEGVGSTTRSLVDPWLTSIYIAPTSISYAFGAPPEASTLTQNLAVPIDSIQVPTGTGDPTTVILSDETTQGGLKRILKEEITRVTTEASYTTRPDQSVIRRVTTTTDNIVRTTIFTRTRTETYDKDGLKLTTSWAVTTSEEGDMTRDIDVKETTFTRQETIETTASYVGIEVEAYPGQARFTPPTAVNILEHFGRTPTGYPGDTGYYESLKLGIPELQFFGTGLTEVRILAASGAVLDRKSVSGAGTLEFVVQGHYPLIPPRMHTIELYRGGTLIASGRVGFVGGSVPISSTLNITGQHPDAAYVRLRLLDADGNPASDWVTQSTIFSGPAVREFVFVGDYSAGQSYEYEAYADSDGPIPYLYHHVRGTIDGEHQNQYAQTVNSRVDQIEAMTMDVLDRYSKHMVPAANTEQNNYVGNLLRSISQGTVDQRFIVRQQGYNAFGEIVTQTDGRVYSTDLTYNDLGKLVKVEQPDTDIYPETGAVVRARPTTYYYYDELGQQVGMQDANSSRAAAGRRYISTQVVVNGRVEREFEARPEGGFGVEANITQHVYDRLGQERQQFDALNQQTTYEYDRLGHLTYQTRYDANGVPHSFDAYEYDADGNRTAHTNALYQREKYLYDGQRRILRYTSFAGRQTSYDYSYDATIGGIGGYQQTTTTLNGLDKQVDRTDYFGKIRYHKDLGGHEFTYRYNYAGWLSEQEGLTAASGRLAQKIKYSYYLNGLVKRIDDEGIASHAEFQYDKNGNRILEAYSKDPLSANLNNAQYYQLASATYDELNRLKSVKEAGRYDIQYTYDAVGNRRSVTSRYFDLLAGTDQTQQFFYKYDRLNRFTITMGTRDGAGNIVRGTTGYEITYDALSRRTSATSDLMSESTGMPQHTKEVYSYDPIGTVNEVFIYQRRDNSPDVPASYDFVARTQRDNDATGSLTDYSEYGATNNPTKVVHYEYDADRLLKWEEDRTTNNANYHTDYEYLGNGTLNSTYATVVNNGGARVGGSEEVSTRYTYEKWDSYKESVVSVTATPSNRRNLRNGSSTYQYDSNGHFKSLFDAQADRKIEYVNNSNGQVLTRAQIDREPSGSDKAPILRNFYYINGRTVGDTGTDHVLSRIDYAQQLAEQEKTDKKGRTSPVNPNLGERVLPVTSADFDQNYQPINDSYPSRTPSTHIVQLGDTLQSVALTMWGDSSLWYLLADANGLTSNDQLVAGLRLTVPNVVTNIHNNAETFRPYDVQAALGDTTPTLPAPPPPKPKKGCGVLLTVLIVVVAIIVTIYTAGLAAGGTSALLAGGTGATATSTFAAGAAALSGGLASTGAGVFAAAIGGAVGSAVSQGVAIAAGLQKGFDFKGVALGAIGSGAAAGLGSLASGSNALSRTFSAIGGSNPYVHAALHGATASALTQGIGVATGLQSSFSWREVAISSLPAAASAATNINGGLAAAVGLRGGIATFANRFVSNIGGSLVRRALGDKTDSTTIVANAFGTAVGDSIKDRLAGPREIEIEISAEDRVQVEAELAAEFSASQVAAADEISREANRIRSNIGAEADLARDVRLLTRELRERLPNISGSKLEQSLAKLGIPDVSYGPEPTDNLGDVSESVGVRQKNPPTDFVNRLYPAVQDAISSAADSLLNLLVPPASAYSVDSDKPLVGKPLTGQRAAKFIKVQEAATKQLDSELRNIHGIRDKIASSSKLTPEERAIVERLRTVLGKGSAYGPTAKVGITLESLDAIVGAGEKIRAQLTGNDPVSYGGVYVRKYPEDDITLAEIISQQVVLYEQNFGLSFEGQQQTLVHEAHHIALGSIDSARLDPDTGKVISPYGYAAAVRRAELNLHPIKSLKNADQTAYAFGFKRNEDK